MVRPFKLNDLQLILLSSAAQRGDGSLLPPPPSIGEPASRIRKVIPPLIKHALVDEVDASSTEQTWRVDGERGIGIVINAAGRAAIGVEPATAVSQPGVVEAGDPAPATSKIGTVLQLLRREQGATLNELVAATGWQPHTTRAALTGLRRKGHSIHKGKRDEVTCYQVCAS